MIVGVVRNAYRAKSGGRYGNCYRYIDPNGAQCSSSNIAQVRARLREYDIRAIELVEVTHGEEVWDYLAVAGLREIAVETAA